MVKYFSPVNTIMVKKMGIGARLKEERERCNFSQSALAERIDATKRSVINWEGGVSSPNAEVLSKIGSLGFDVLYVLTGQRNSAAPASQPELTRRKSALLDNYDHLSESDKAALERTAFALAKQGRVSKKGKTA